jgi:2-methylcitrate dehydratase PrpD
MTFTQDLARRVLGVKPADISADTRHWAIVSILDTLGVAIAGAAEPGVRILDRVVTGGRSEGPCVLFGTDRRASLLDAALINGMAAHALDFDASNPYFAGHATMHLLAGTFAVAEVAEASGAEFLLAYIAGFEAQSRLARALQPAHSDKGWFPSSTIGVFGMAAAAGRLLRLSEAQLATAFGIAANLASGLLANAGTMTKPLAAGHSARNGVLAARLAQEGFTAPMSAFEHQYGFLKMFDVAGQFDGKAALAGWGQPFDVAVTAIGLKQHPCCGIVHSAIDALGSLIAEHDIAADDVTSVKALLVTDRLSHVDRPHPTNPLDAKFSGYYCLARTILHGRPRLEDFEGEAHHDPVAAALMKRISIAVHPDMRDDMPRTQQDGAQVVVTLSDGRRLEGRLDKPFGREPGNPIPDHLLHQKFLGCAERVLSSNVAQRLLAKVLAIDEAERLGDLAGVMAGGCQPEDAREQLVH